MLITNFAAGELSETLFGRTDLPQYYQGVSFLENFEVIPTGGIERRNGMKRVLEMEREGRIIPFILDREESFLLYLMPQVSEGGVTKKARIQIYRNGVKQGEAVDSTAAPLPRTMAEINEVQYAQNHEMMLLVHEGYAPLSAVLQKTAGGYRLSVRKFEIDIEIELSYPEDLSPLELKPYEKEDSTYSERGYLQEIYQYPRCVTFFGGRLIFAGTISNPQRIFASRVNNPANFSTHKIFLTKQRNYVAVEGKVAADPYVIELSTAQDVAKLSGNLTDYIPNSPILGDARIVSLKGFDLRLSKPINLSALFTETDRAQVGSMISAYDAYNENRTPLHVAYFDDPLHPGDPQFQNQYYTMIGSSMMGMMHKDYGSSTERHLSAEWGARAVYDAAKTYTVNDLAGIIRSRLEDPNIPHIIGGTLVVLEANLAIAATLWYERIRDTMKYAFNGEVYYDYPIEILAKLDQQYGGTDYVYLSFYTETILDENYPTPDDGFTFEIASDMSDAIRWIAQNKNLLIGTETAEWVIPAGITATSVQAILNSRYGSDRIQGTSVGDALCFFQSGRKALVEYYIPQQDNNFRANNMALLSKNMLHEAAAFDFDFISAPYTKLFVSREDGIVAALLYERGTGTFAWGRIRTSGRIRSVATVPGPSGYDDVYLIVERSGYYFLEMLAERRRSDEAPDAEVFLDSYEPWTGDAWGYTEEAVVYDELNRTTYTDIHNNPPPAGEQRWVGYPYTSRVRSMPVLANDRMKPNIIKNLSIRFTGSFMPKVRAVSMDEGAERRGNTDTISRKEPYSGIVRVPFPGVWDRDVFFELIHDQPTCCRVLAVNAEAN